MSIEPNRSISIAIPLPLSRSLTREKERINIKAILNEPTVKLNIATHRAFNIVGNTVDQILTVDEAVSPLQSELLKQASHIYVQRRIQEACIKFPPTDNLGINQVETRDRRIMDEFTRTTVSKRDDCVDLLTEQMSDNLNLKKINPQSTASNIIDAVANYLFIISSDPNINLMIVDSKRRRRRRTLIERLDNQIKKFLSGEGVDMKKIVDQAEEIFQISGESLLPKAREMADIYTMNNPQGTNLTQSFELKGGRLIDGLQSVLKLGVASYDDVFQAEADPEIAAIMQNVQADQTPAPQYFINPPPESIANYQAQLFQDLASAVSVAASNMFINSLSTPQRISHNVKQFLHNLDPKEPRGRRNLINLLLLIVLVTACTPQSDASPNLPPSPTPLSPLMTDKSIPPEIAVLMSITGRTNFDILGTLPLDPTQRDLLYQLLISNQESVLNGIPLSQINMDPSLKVGCSICSDSRMVFDTPSIANGISIVPEGLVESANIGTQPTVYKEINQSFFITHGCSIGDPSGCGALGGVKALLENPQYGRQYLLDHGVSDLTINQLDDLIRQGATADPILWAQNGAKIQAELNLAANGTNHFVAYGFKGVADGSFQILGVVDSYGTIYSIDDFPLLKGYAEFFNNPHDVIAAIKAGQTPKINVINASKFSTNAVVGDMAAEPGVVFKTAKRGATLTYEEAVNMVGGFDYSGAHLTQRGNFLTLVADNADDMTILRTALLNEGVKEGKIADFLSRGGVIVEMIPDETGKFVSMTIRRAEELGVELRRLDLLKSGLLSVTTRAEFVELAKANKLGSLLSEEQIVRLAKFYEVSRPFMPFLKGILQAVGDYWTIKDLAKFVDEDLMGHELVYEYYPQVNNILRYPDYSRMTFQEIKALKDAFPGANPYVTSGLVQGVSINQGALSDAYLGAFNAYYDRGPGMPNAASPWKEIESASDLAKMLILNVPVETDSAGPGDPVLPPIKLYTSLLIKPAFEIVTDANGAEIGRYTSFTPQILNDDNQKMMLYDELTGLFTSPDDGSIQFVAVDENGFKYLMKTFFNPETKSFEFRFIAPLGY